MASLSALFRKKVCRVHKKQSRLLVGLLMGMLFFYFTLDARKCFGSDDDFLFGSDIENELDLEDDEKSDSDADDDDGFFFGFGSSSKSKKNEVKAPVEVAPKNLGVVSPSEKNKKSENKDNVGKNMAKGDDVVDKNQQSSPFMALRKQINDKIRRFQSDKSRKNSAKNNVVRQIGEIENRVKVGKSISERDIERWVAKNRDVNVCLENGRTMLLYLAEKSDNPYAIQFLLENQAELQPHCIPSHNALLLAASHNPHSNVIDLLIENEANWADKDEYGNTALILGATYNPNPDVIDLFLLNGLKINNFNDYGHTALMLATYNNSVQMVSALIAGGADVNMKDQDGRTALMIAGLIGDKDKIKLLLSYGADASARDKYGFGVAEYFAQRNYLSLSSFSQGEELNLSKELSGKFDFVYENFNKYRTLLQNGVYQNKKVLVKHALDMLADTETKDENGCTMLLRTAQDNSKYEIFEALLTHYAFVDATCGDDENALIRLLNRPINSEDEVKDLFKKAKLLIDYHIDVNYRDAKGNSALYYVLQQGGSLPLVKLLVENGANQNILNAKGEQALKFALDNQMSDELILFLCRYGADMNIRGEDGETPFWLIFYVPSRLQLVLGMIAMQSDINMRGINGDTPLIYALKKEYPPQIIKALIEKGANPMIQDAQGYNAFDIIKRNPYFNMTIYEENRADALEHW